MLIEDTHFAVGIGTKEIDMGNIGMLAEFELYLTCPFGETTENDFLVRWLSLC